MASKKGFVTILAAGAVFAALAAMAKKMHDDGRTDDLEKAAVRIKEKITKSAEKLGSMSKSAYENIVDTAMDEFKGVKQMSSADLRDLKRELKGSWKDVQAMLSPEVEHAKRTVKKAARKAVGHARRVGKAARKAAGA